MRKLNIYLKLQDMRRLLRYVERKQRKGLTRKLNILSIYRRKDLKKYVIMEQFQEFMQYIVECIQWKNISALFN